MICSIRDKSYRSNIMRETMCYFGFKIEIFQVPCLPNPVSELVSI